MGFIIFQNKIIFDKDNVDFYSHFPQYHIN